MPKEYAYIPPERVGDIPQPENFSLMIMNHYPIGTGVLDSYGEEMYELISYVELESDANGFTPQQRANIVSLGGEYGSRSTHRDIRLPAWAATRAQGGGQ